MDVAGSSFVQGIEVWIPEGELLQRQFSGYLRRSGLEQVSTDRVLRKGQGLPGLCWSTGRAEVWQRLDARLAGGAPAQPPGLDAAVAVPCYRGSEIGAVVAFLCGASSTSGCIEVWEPNDYEQLVHADGYYGRLAEFEDVSRAMRFARGEGLPGVTWERRRPQIIADLATSSSFLRSELARESGVRSGLGLPVLRAGSVSEVVLFLSAQSTPLARAFEIWTPDDRGLLRLEQSYYAPGLEAFAAQARARSFARGEGLPGGVLASERPQVVEVADAGSFLRHEAATEAGLELALGLPIHDGRQVRSVVVMLS